jgi:hypothetical protein
MQRAYIKIVAIKLACQAYFSNVALFVDSIEINPFACIISGKQKIAALY